MLTASNGHQEVSGQLPVQGLSPYALHPKPNALRVLDPTPTNQTQNRRKSTKFSSPEPSNQPERKHIKLKGSLTRSYTVDPDVQKG